MPGVTTPPPTGRGLWFDKINSRIALLYDGTAFLRGTASAVTLPLATTISGLLTAAAGVVSSSAAQAIGYATGAGGTVTQLTNKQTGVTLSKPCGQITMNNEALAAGAETTFIVTNTLVAATDVVIAVHGSAGTSGAYLVNACTMGAGVFSVVVSNVSAGSLSEAIVINFVVIKGVAA